MTGSVPRPESPRSQSHRLTRPWKVQPPYLLTIGEAAAVLGFTEGTLRRYCDRGLIGHITWRWKYGITARARRYIPRVALIESLEKRQPGLLGLLRGRAWRVWIDLTVVGWWAQAGRV